MDIHIIYNDIIFSTYGKYMKTHVSTMRFSCHAYTRCVCILHMANIAIANLENTEKHVKNKQNTPVYLASMISEFLNPSNPLVSLPLAERYNPLAAHCRTPLNGLAFQISVGITKAQNHLSSSTITKNPSILFLSLAPRIGF